MKIQLSKTQWEHIGKVAGWVDGVYQFNSDSLKLRGLCPVCGANVNLIGTTKDGRLIGECKDAFTVNQWEKPDDSSSYNQMTGHLNEEHRPPEGWVGPTIDDYQRAITK